MDNTPGSAALHRGLPIFAPFGGRSRPALRIYTKSTLFECTPPASARRVARRNPSERRTDRAGFHPKAVLSITIYAGETPTPPSRTSRGPWGIRDGILPARPLWGRSCPALRIYTKSTRFGCAAPASRDRARRSDGSSPYALLGAFASWRWTGRAGDLYRTRESTAALASRRSQPVRSRYIRMARIFSPVCARDFTSPTHWGGFCGSHRGAPVLPSDCGFRRRIQPRPMSPPITAPMRAPIITDGITLMMSTPFAEGLGRSR